jgi:hypothetical protein
MHLARAAELADALLVVVGTDTRLTLVRARIGLALRRPPERLGGLLKAREERIGSVRSRSRGSSTGTGSMCSDGTGNSTCQRKDGLCAVGTRIVVHAAECMGSGANTGAGRSSTRARSVAKATGEGFVRVEKCAILAFPFRRSTSHMRCSTATYWPFSTPTAPGGGDWATSRCNSGQGRPSCGSIPYLAHRRQERRDSERLERRQHLVRRDRHLERRPAQGLQRSAGAAQCRCSAVQCSAAQRKWASEQRPRLSIGGDVPKDHGLVGCTLR